MNQLQPEKVQVERSNSPRVVLIASNDTFFCYSNLLKNLLTALDAQSIPAILVCPQNKESICENVETIRHPAIQLPLMNFQNNKILIEQLEKFKPTILHCLCQSKLLLTRYLAAKLNIPYVISVVSFQKKWTQFLFSKHLARIIVPSKIVAENLAKVWPKFADRIVQINPGVIVKEYAKPVKVGQISTIVTACKLKDAQQFKPLLNAVRHLIIEGQEFMLVIIGDGSSENKFHQLVVSLGLSEVVTITDKPRPWPAMLADADFFIQARPSSKFNPFLLQAISEGAAVASCKGGVDDLIIDGQTALTFDPNDELNIYDTLKRLLDSRELCQKLSANAKQLLSSDYNISTMTNQILNIYRQS